jgi:hypothetical protein
VILTDPTDLPDLRREAYDVKRASEIHSFHGSERNPERLRAQVEQAANSCGYLINPQIGAEGA